jgi:hypothetical protein
MSIVDEFANHFERQFRTLEGAYERASERAWACEDDRLKGVWQWLLHTLETFEFYLGERPADAFPWGHRFNLDWEDAETDHVPSKAEMHAYQRDVEQFVQQVLADKSDAHLAAAEAAMPWTGKLYTGKLLYVMRHTQQHIGDINRVLRWNGDQALEWH